MNISILHGYSDSNKGDLAIVLATIQALSEICPAARVTVHSVFDESDPEFLYHHRFMLQLGVRVCSLSIPSPYIDNQAHSIGRNMAALWKLAKSILLHTLSVVQALRGRRIARESIDVIKDADIVFLKGGQYIYNDQGTLRGWLYLWRILSPIHAAVRLKKPVTVLGQSIGPVKGRIASRMVGAALAKCRKVVVREQLSADLMVRLGVGDRTVLAPDFAFLIEPRAPSDSEARFSELANGSWLAVTVINWSFPGSSNPRVMRDRYESVIVDACEHMYRNHGLGVALFPQVTVRHHGESDDEVINRIADKLRSRSVRVFTTTEDLWPNELAYLYGRCKLLLGTRLHSCILAACASCPVVAIRYQGFKTEGVMQQLSMGDYVHDINSLDTDQLTSSMEGVLASRDAISLRLQKHTSSFKFELNELLSDELGLGGDVNPLLNDN